MTDVVVGVGSNFNARSNIASALEALTELFGKLDVSPLYQSADLNEGQGLKLKTSADYFNMALAFSSPLTASAVIALLKRIEVSLGRTPHSKANNQVPIDLDLLLFGDDSVVVDGREYPAIEVTQRSFILAPLADVAGGQIDKESKLSYRQLWQNFDASSQPLERIEFAFDELS